MILELKKDEEAINIIDEAILLKQSHRFRDPRQLEKDYLLTLLLFEIYREFDYRLIFKGGTSLKYFYNLNRFSEDLDFSYTGKNSSEERGMITGKFERVIDSLDMEYKVVRREHRGNKENGTVIGINFELRTQGPLNERLGQMQNIAIDVSLRNDVLKGPENKYLLPPYQDIPLFLVPVMNVEEIVAEKIASIMEMDRMRDIYDLYFLLHLRGVKYDDSLLLEKMNRRGERFDMGVLKEKINEANNLMKWTSELSYLINPLPANSNVVQTIEELLHLD